MKKISMFVSLSALLICLAACGGSGENPGQSTQPSESAPSAENTPTVEESSTVDDLGDEDDWDNTDDWGDEDDWGDAGSAWSDEMQKLKDAVVAELGDSYWPSMAMSVEYVEGTIGVAAGLYDDFMGEIPMMSAHVDTLLIVKAKDGQAQEVEKALNVYRENVVSNTMQYPMNMGKIQASKVESIGNYVCFVQLGGDVLEVEADGDEAVIRHCQEQNDRAIEAIAACLEQ